MFYKELDSIKAIEDKADAMVQQANADAKTLVEQAKQEAEQILEKADNDANEILKKYKEEGRILAEDNYRDQMAQAETKATEMRVAARNNVEAAINIISERIVKDSVNC